MSLHMVQGGMGAGKSYIAVNREMQSYLENSERPIYTNLPCDGDELDAWMMTLTRNPARRQVYRRRITFLPEASGVVAVPLFLQEDRNTRGELVRRKLVPLKDEDGDAVEADVLCEFWFFTLPNAVIFLDELADIYNAVDRASRPETLASYINHHRHYKDDLWFFAQDKDDIDTQIRRKVQYVFDVRNSVFENIWSNAWMRGFKWPVQFFMVRVYLGKQVFNKSGDLKRFEPQRGYWVVPNKRGFEHYRSFSHSAKLGGKKVADETAQSSNLQSFWQRVGAWGSSAMVPASYALAVGMAIYLGLRAVYWMANGGPGESFNDYLFHDRDQPRTNWVAQAQPAAVPVSSPATNVEPLAVVQPVASAPVVAVVVTNRPERLVLVTPTAVVTDRRRIRVGDAVGGGVVRRILLNGVELDNGEQRRFADLLL
jgi:hypothetical protein